MSLRGHAAISFNVHRDGTSPRLRSWHPREVEGFNNAAFNALAVTSPTLPLPEEYPSEKAFITVTFYLQRDSAVLQRTMTPPTRSQQLGLLVLLAALTVFVVWGGRP